MIPRLLLVWLINTLALIAVAYLMPSISVSSFEAALIAALVLGLVNAIVRPVLVLLTLPVTILTLGLFIFVLNGLLLDGRRVARGLQRRRLLGGRVRRHRLQPRIVAALGARPAD